MFEVRTCDRAIRMARGEFVCLLQDDDILPANNIWVEQALTLFNFFPYLIMLGGRNGIDIMMPEPADPQSLQEYRQIGDLVYPVECPGLHKLRLYGAPRYQEPSSGINKILMPSIFMLITLSTLPMVICKTSLILPISTWDRQNNLNSFYSLYTHE